MPVLVRELRDKKQTGREMYRVTRRYAHDLDRIRVARGRTLTPLSRLTLHELHTVVKKLPYERDVSPVEVVARPLASIKLAGSYGIDCKKKAAIMGAWCELHGFPWRYVCGSTRADGRIHHVWPQIQTGRQWRNIDATYPEYRMFGVKQVTNFEVLNP